MGTTDIQQKVKVGAVFEGLKVTPKWFLWCGKKHAIEQVTFTWKTKEGDAQVIHFAVTDGATGFELSFNQKSLQWTLENSAPEN